MSPLICFAKRLPLGLLALLSLMGYVSLGLWFPLVPHFDSNPQPDVAAFTPSLAAGLGYAVLLCVLFGLYWLASRRALQNHASLRPGQILLIAALFSLPLLFTFPFNATDVYRYFIRGRITVVYSQSPFSMAPDAFPADPYLSLAGYWAKETSPYGPAWELVAAAVVRFSRDNLLLGLLLFKGLAALTHLAISGLIWLILDDVGPAERIARTLLWAWNPALLLTFVVDGHNDVLMVFWLLLGYLLLRRGWLGLGMTVLVLATLTKPVGLLVLPFFFLATWKGMASARSRVRFLLASAMGSLALTWLAFLPFGSPLDLVQRLIQESTASGGFSPTALFILAARGLGFDPTVRHVVRVANALFGLLTLWLLWRTWHGRSPIRTAVDIFAAYLAQAFGFRIWYAAWPFPWLVLDSADGSRRLRVGLWLLMTSQLSVVVYSHLWEHVLGKSRLLSHLIGVPFTLVLPLLLAHGRFRRR